MAECLYINKFMFNALPSMLYILQVERSVFGKYPVQKTFHAVICYYAYAET